MRDYGKVHTTFWSSPTIRSMSEDGRALALYLLTNPHGTCAGVFRLPDGYVCDDIQWPYERVSKGFAELLAKGFANRCETTKWVWICKYLDWEPPENPNQRKSAAKIAQSIPDECGWKQAFMLVCGQLLGIEAQPFRNPFETLTEPFRNQEQEQEQEQEQRKVKDDGKGGVGGNPTAPPAASPLGQPPPAKPLPALAEASPKPRLAAQQADALRAHPALAQVEPGVLADWLTVRKAKRAGPVTATVVAALQRETAQAGISVAEAVRCCCEQGWQGFRAQWHANLLARRSAAGAPVRESFRERDDRLARERVAALTGQRVQPPPSSLQSLPPADVIDVAARAVEALP